MGTSVAKSPSLLLGRDSNLKGNFMGNIESQDRLWSTLDAIVKRLESIEDQVREIVRIEERVTSHGQALKRYGNRLDDHDARIRGSEIWQAGNGDNSVTEKTLGQIEKEISVCNRKIAGIEADKNITKGKKDILKEILKWTTGVLSVIIVYLLTGQL